MVLRIFDSIVNYVMVVINFLNGKFGRYRLIQPYRRIWKIITWTTVMVIAWIYVVCPFFDCWQRIVNHVNYVIWG